MFLSLVYWADLRCHCDRCIAVRLESTLLEFERQSEIIGSCGLKLNASKQSWLEKFFDDERTSTKNFKNLTKTESDLRFFRNVLWLYPFKCNVYVRQSKAKSQKVSSSNSSSSSMNDFGGCLWVKFSQSMDEIERKIRDKRQAIITSQSKTKQNETKQKWNTVYGLFSFSLVSAIFAHLFTFPLNNRVSSIGPLFLKNRADFWQAIKDRMNWRKQSSKMHALYANSIVSEKEMLEMIYFKDQCP